MKRKYDPELIQEDLRKLIQQTLKEALEAELEEFLGHSKYERGEKDNYRNGYISKTVKTAVGEVEIETPRDRNGKFEPKIVKKRQKVLKDLEDKVITLYSKGMSVRDIQELLLDMYGMEISPSLISKLTEKILPRLEEWQSRPLDKVYVILFVDCIFYKVREEGRVKDKAIYVIIGAFCSKDAIVDTASSSIRKSYCYVSPQSFFTLTITTSPPFQSTHPVS